MRTDENRSVVAVERAHSYIRPVAERVDEWSDGQRRIIRWNGGRATVGPSFADETTRRARDLGSLSDTATTGSPTGPERVLDIGFGSGRRL